MIDALVPPGARGRRRMAWRAFFILAPLALGGGLLLVAAVDPRARLGLTFDRQGAIVRGQQAAAAAGLDVRTWTTTVRAERDGELSFYYRAADTPERAQLRRAFPDVSLHAGFTSPATGERFEAELAPDGRLLGFERRLPPGPPPPQPADASAARDIAARAAAAWAADHGFTLGPLEGSETATNASRAHEFTWTIPAPALPELTLRLRVDVRGDTVVLEHASASVAAAYARATLNRPPSYAKAVVVIALILFFVVVIIAAIYRYLLRSKQREAPHARSLVVSAVMAGAVVLGLLVSDAIAASTNAEGPAAAWILPIMLGIVFIIMGAAVGIAWGSGEGDLRELYPGRVTSLDALILGKLWSVNVARAILIGGGFASWLLLGYGVVLAIPGHRPGYGMALEEVTGMFARAPALAAFLESASGGLATAAMVLLVPLPILRRLFKSNWLFFSMLALTTLAFSSAGLADYRPLPVALVLVAMLVAALLVPFFTHDLLAAIVSYTAFDLLLAVVGMLVQPAWSLRLYGLVTAGLILVIAAIACVAVVNAAEYAEADVRPVYAAELAERIALQAEVGAAREAQLRLLPRTIPHVPGVSISASCQPAREVGGDFYDVYRVNESTLGLFVADGGGRGVDAALVIAMAKGFLMPTAHLAAAPAEIMGRLHGRIATWMDESAGGGFLYGLVDAADGRFHYARRGVSPTILVRSAATGVVAPVDEAPATVHVNGTAVVVLEARVALSSGDQVICITDGVNRLLGAGGVHAVDEWMTKTLVPAAAASAGAAHDALVQAMTRHARSARRAGVQDDMTTVVIHAEAFPAATRSAVA